MSNLAKAQELFFAGLDAQNGKRLDVAERLYREALLLAPDRPSVLNNLATVLLLQRKYAASQEICEHLLALNPSDATTYMNLGNAQAGLKQMDAALTSYDRALVLDPDHAQVLTNRGKALSALGKHNKALESLDLALRLSPDNPDTLINRGNVLKDLQRPGEALAQYERALEFDPGNASALSNIGDSLLDAGRPMAALAACEQALKFHPDFPEALQTYGNALCDLKRYPEALAFYARAAKLAPDRPGPFWNESLCRLLLGDLELGWQNYERGWEVGQRGKLKLQFDKPAWDGVKTPGTLLAWGEQGIGDQILHCSMLNELSDYAARLIVAVDPRLLFLMRRSFAGIEFVSLLDTHKIRDFDAHVALGDLGSHFRKSWKNFPIGRRAFLQANNPKSLELRARLNPKGKLLCGISWRSTSPKSGKFKTMLLEDLAPVIAIPGLKCVDLQYGDTSDERLALQNTTGLELAHVDDIDNFHDIDALASLIDACDIVVSVSNTTVHLAGALGKPTLVMLPYALGRIWYWHENRDQSPWYPSCRLFRQPAHGDWRPVIAEVISAVSTSRAAGIESRLKNF